MIGINRLANLASNFVAFVLFVYGLQSIINSVALYVCSAAAGPVGLFSVICLLAPLFKFLFVKFKTKEEKVPRALIELNIAPVRVVHREDKHGDV